MRLAWTGETFSHHGDRFHYDGVRVRPAPKRMDVWLGGQAPSELRRVGRLADGWLPSFVLPADVAAGRAVIEAVAAEHDREIEDDHYGVLIPYAFGPSRISSGPCSPSVDPTSTTSAIWCRRRGTS